jgi:ABC-type amino acid transport substrate-binding protein
MNIITKFNKIFVIISSIFSILLAGCDKVEEKKDTKPTIKVLISPDNPPMTYAEEKNSEVVFKGFEVELIELIANELDIEIEIVSTNFEGIVAGLQSNADIAISSINSTVERSKSVTFSKPYLTSSIKIVSKKYIETEDVPTILTNKKIGVQAGTLMSDFLTHLKQSNPSCHFEIFLFDTILSEISAFNSGIVDIIIVETLTDLSGIKSKYSSITLNQKTEYAIAIGKNSNLPVEDINKVIENCAEKIQKIKEKYNIGS